MAGDRNLFDGAVEKAHSYAWDKQWMKAIEQYRLATAEFPDDATARSGLGFAYLQAERLREALREYRKVSELTPDDPSPVMKRAQILERLGRITDAGHAWTHLAELYEKQRVLSQAADAWREVVRLQPAYKEARRRLAEACELQSNTAVAVEEYLALARMSHEDGERAQAVVYCKKVLSLDRGSDKARALLKRLIANGDTGVLEPSLLVPGEELGPVDLAVQGALSSLAEAVLGEEELVQHPEEPHEGPAELQGLASGSHTGITAVLGKAIDFHSQGMIQEALGYYEQALEMGVGRVDVVFNLGVLYKEALRFSDAIDLLGRSLEVPEYALASNFALGECHWAEGRIGQALDHFLEALKIIDLDMMSQDWADDIAPLYQDLANSYRDQANRRKAEVLVNSLRNFLSGHGWKARVLEARRKLDNLADGGIVSILPEFLEVPGGEQVLDIMARSWEYLRNDMPFTALEECYRAVEMAPTYLPLHLRIAETFAHQGKVEEAVSKYAAVADSYLMRDSPHQAMAVYGRALLVAPMSVSIREKLITLLIEHDQVDRALGEYLALGESYYRLARVDRALEKYEDALPLVGRTATPADWEVKILHRMADLQLQRVHWKGAVALYEKIRELAPTDEEARLRLVELHYKLGQEDVALRELDSLIVHLGKQREFQKIIKSLRELVDSNPQDIPLRSRLSGLYIELGMKQEAIGELDTLGELQLEVGRRRDAAETLRTIISLEPKEKEGYTQLLRELGEY